MTAKLITPSTIAGIKRLAKQIRNSKNIPHHQALNEASKNAGFENYRHAQNHLLYTNQNRASSTRIYKLYLTVYWKNLESQQSGRETLKISLLQPWTELLKPSELKWIRSLKTFATDAPDHLFDKYRASTQIQARYAVCHAARTLMFIDATRLRPSRGYSAFFPQKMREKRIPGQDHISVWHDEQKRYVITDEPYDTRVETNQEARESWCRTNHFVQAKSSWLGMHNPFGGTSLFLISSSVKGVPLEPLLKSLEELPSPPNELIWQGESGSYIPSFFSPEKLKRSKSLTITRAKCEPTHQITVKPATLGYIRTFVGPQRRPNGKLPISTHQEIGLMLKEMLVNTSYRKVFYNRIDSVRDELDEWAMREYSDHSELPNDAFHELYYHGNLGDYLKTITSQTAERFITYLHRIKSLLVTYYPTCAPLRRIIKWLEEAEKSLLSWIVSSNSSKTH